MALALLGLVIGVLADLAREYSHLIAFARAKDNTAVAVAALERMGRESEQSLSILEPAVGVSGDVLSLEVIDTDSPLRIQNLAGWEPDRASDRLQIRYELRERDLARVQTGATTTEMVMASEIDGFAVSYPDTRQVRIEISIRERQRVATFVTLAFRWVE